MTGLTLFGDFHLFPAYKFIFFFSFLFLININIDIVSNKTEPASAVVYCQRVTAKAVWGVHMVPPSVDKWN